jgi:hypothetical protein
MAKTYLDVNPSHNIVIVDANASIGGVWSKDRLYPSLKSNNMLGTFEWSDWPMDTETFGVKSGEHIPGEVVHKYLCSYAEKFDLVRRIELNSKVETAEAGPDDAWTLRITQCHASKQQTVMMVTNKLVVATGMTSESNMPRLKGEDNFGRPLFHFADFPKHISTLATTKRVAILGGAKSAWDAVYSYAEAGVEVEWIIRKSGHGPIWMSPPYVTPLKKWLEKLCFTRFLTWFSPCIWGDADGYGRIRGWLHGSSIGRWVVNKFWWVLGNDLVTLNGYDKHPETAKLKPWYEAFWVGSMLGILNYPTDFFAFVRNGLIKVHIADIETLSEGTVCLSDGQALNVDLLCCATGWKHRPSIQFLPAGIEQELGLSYFTERLDDLSAKADAEIFNKFPKLKEQPSVIRNLNEGSMSKENPIRGHTLYRFMVPPANVSKRNIGFCGMLIPLSASMVSQLQALWLTAYFAGEIDNLQSLRGEDIQWQAQLENRYCSLRHPAANYPDFVFDSIPYNDLLLKDLGMVSHRKSGILAELFEAYGPEDYKRLVKDWKTGAYSGTLSGSAKKKI